MKINKNKYFYILLPLVLGMIIGYFFRSYDTYNDLIKPELSPSKIVFPIVWSILYLIMGYSAYLISVSKSEEKNESLYLYYLQLFVNLTWPVIFFNLELYFLSFIWIVLLIVLVLNMIKSFYKINPLAAKLNIPYLLWLIFAAYLNYQIYLLN